MRRHWPGVPAAVGRVAVGIGIDCDVVEEFAGREHSLEARRLLVEVEEARSARGVAGAGIAAGVELAVGVECAEVDGGAVATAEVVARTGFELLFAAGEVRSAVVWLRATARETARVKVETEYVIAAVGIGAGVAWHMVAAGWKPALSPDSDHVQAVQVQVMLAAVSEEAVVQVQFHHWLVCFAVAATSICLAPLA